MIIDRITKGSIYNICQEFDAKDDNIKVFACRGLKGDPPNVREYTALIVRVCGSVSVGGRFA